ncbi:hypothetical protein B0H10DRAFT_1959338 [Mycena sp. CBHHK59/15]|nr:hypothetical protein B0H10DRAFT_1959338 [Mycena sp. CBHHK59/15]
MVHPTNGTLHTTELWNKKCLIDDYDQIHRDFKPFYQLAKDDPAHFQKTIERDSHQFSHVPLKLRRRVACQSPLYGCKKNAFTCRDLTPFDIVPRPTVNFLKQQSGCIVPMDTTWLMLSANEDCGCNPHVERETRHGQDLPVFLGYLVPTEVRHFHVDAATEIDVQMQYYYDQSWWTGKFAHPDNIRREDKKPQIYWRGMSTGGMIMGQNYHHFVRIKLADLDRNHSADGCFDYSSTLFEGYFNAWLTPYEHYIPVLPDLSDPVEKIEWANANPEEVRRIARRVITDDQNDCYFCRLA